MRRPIARALPVGPSALVAALGLAAGIGASGVGEPIVAQAQAAVATIVGAVEIPAPARPAAARPNVSGLGMAEGHDAPDWRRSVVYLETAPRGAFEEREERARMDQRREAFVPHILAITVGTTVDFPNNDATYHNVFSLSKTKSFDLGRYAAGHSKSVRFDRPGIVRVFCDIHSHMSGFILVFNHRFFAVTDDHGQFRIPDVPPGTYTLAVWNERLPQATAQVVVPAGADTVRVNIALRQGEP